MCNPEMNGSSLPCQFKRDERQKYQEGLGSVQSASELGVDTDAFGVGASYLTFLAVGGKTPSTSVRAANNELTLTQSPLPPLRLLGLPPPYQDSTSVARFLLVVAQNPSCFVGRT